MQEIIINRTELIPGKNQKLDIPIAHLPSGTDIDLVVHTFRAKKPGPTLLVIGGVHGDEINGIEIVRGAVKQKLFQKLKRGTVLAIPLLNVYGFINFSREFPSGKDVNRSFPGTRGGSLASRVARTLTKQILPVVDYGLDFHTGGSSIYNYPQTRVYRNDPESLKLAEMFGMPYTVETGLIDKSLRKTAYRDNIPMVVFEGGESLRLDPFSVQTGIEGIKRVLKGLDMKNISTQTSESKTISSSKWIRASRSGIFKWEKKSGEEIIKGDVLGRITDPYNSFSRRVIAKQSGVIYGHNNSPVVSQGDALFHIGL